MSASVGLQIVGGFYRSRHRYERPGHVYPEWENPPLHYVTDDRIAWHKQNLPIYEFVRYSKAGNTTTDLTEIDYGAFNNVIHFTGNEVRYQSVESVSTTDLTETAYASFSANQPLVSIVRYTNKGHKTDRVLTELAYASFSQQQPITVQMRTTEPSVRNSPLSLTVPIYADLLTEDLLF